MLVIRGFITLLMWCIIITSCTNSIINTEHDYYSYINDDANGLIQTHSTNGITLKVRYLPAQLQALEESRLSDVVLSVDSLVNHYGYLKSFLVSIEPSPENKDLDIHLYGIASEEALAKRQHLLNFEIGRYFTLKYNDASYKPHLFYAQSNHGLSKSVIIKLMFVAEDEASAIVKGGDFKLTFADPIYDTGMNQFSFKKRDIKSIPGIGKNY